MLRCLLSGAALLVAAHVAAQVPLYENLDSLPLAVLPPQYFVNVPMEDGRAKGLEFSSALQFGPHLLVSDDEVDPVIHAKLEGLDTGSHCLFELLLSPAGDFRIARPWPAAFKVPQEFDDIESTTARGPLLWMMGSHSFNKSGSRRPKREVLLLLDMGGPQPHLTVKPTGIREQLVALVRGLPGVTLSAEEISATLNIEGLTIDPASRDLLFGLKAPLIGPDRKALLVRLKDPEPFMRGTAPALTIQTELLLDAKGSGFSSIEWDPVLQGYIVATSFKDPTGEGSGSSIWLWKGGAAEPREICRFRNLALEGVCRILQGPLAGNILLAFDNETVDERYRLKDGGILSVVAWGTRRGS